MRTTVIISTYNQPLWLEKTLWGYASQTRRDFQIIVADDGSGPETRATIDRVRHDSGLVILHLWQEDRGFRKCEILNRAIIAAEGDYLIFSDGDCIPRDDFVDTHIRLASPGRYLSGGVVHTSRAISELITLDDVRSGRFLDPVWLRAHGHRAGRRSLRLLRRPHLMTLLDSFTTTPSRFNGGNASVWRTALFEVNGFDAEMGYGWEDRALGQRLRNSGVRGKQVRHRAVCLHLEHDRPYRTPEELRRNRATYDRVTRNRETWARTGIRDSTP